MTFKRIVRSHGDLFAVAQSLVGLAVDKPLMITAEPVKSRRSLQANAYLWGALYPAIQKHVRETCGQLYSSEELHEFFKARLLDPSIVDLGVEQCIVAGSSAKLTVAEFAEFTAQIEAYFVSDLGGQLPAHPSYAETA